MKCWFPFSPIVNCRPELVGGQGEHRIIKFSVVLGNIVPKRSTVTVNVKKDIFFFFLNRSQLALGLGLAVLQVTVMMYIFLLKCLTLNLI